MIVPRYWAEGRAQQLTSDGKPITARRFGWSDTSPADAQTMADTRARETLALLVAGQPVPRRDPERPYPGADGVPIREQIVSRHEETILTRNAYGALCLNTPNVFFADVDFRPPAVSTPFGVPIRLALFLAVYSLCYAAPVPFLHHFALLPGTLAAWLFGNPLAAWAHRRFLPPPLTPEAAALARVRRFATENPDWSLRLYRTPLGLRVLATDQTFSPDHPAVAAAFSKLGADPVYVRMCLRQRCFRARVSPKPWRIGVREHIRPRRAVWPVAPEVLPARAEWVVRYDEAARPFAACRFLEALGPGEIHLDVQPVLDLHDSLCQANTALPVA